MTNELYLSQIPRSARPVCRTLADVRAHLVRLRRAVIAAAGRDGSRIAAAGTHPFSHWEAQALTPKPRYFGIADDFQQLAREQIIFGCHVHVGIADRDAATAVMNRARPWLPTLLALSGNSPFWLGLDTGFSSYRTELFGRFPMTGIPHEFASRAEFDDLVASLVAAGVIDDGSKIYWDVRPSSHVETIEFRVADVCTTIDEAVMIAGLCRALARACCEAYIDADEPARADPPGVPPRRKDWHRLAERPEGRPDRRPRPPFGARRRGDRVAPDVPPADARNVGRVGRSLHPRPSRTVAIAATRPPTASCAAPRPRRGRFEDVDQT